MERIQIKTQEIIKQQPSGIQDFLNKVQIWQDQEKEALIEMNATKLEELPGFLYIEIILQQSINYENLLFLYEKNQFKDSPSFENEVKLCLWLNDKIIKFSWQEIILTEQTEQSSLNVFRRLIDHEQIDENINNLKRACKFQLQLDGICCNHEIKILDGTFKMSLLSIKKDIEVPLQYNQFPKGIQHFIKELLIFYSSWQQYFLIDLAEPSWKFITKESEDLILNWSFEEYIVKHYGGFFLRKELENLPKQIYLQLLTYSAKDPLKFQLLKAVLFDFYELLSRWPKDIIEIILIYYDKNFERRLNELEKEFIFVAMRFHDCPFYPEAKSDDEIYDELGKLNPNLSISDFTDFSNDFIEWKEWVNGLI
ncbi:MAG: hypothetical protein ACQETL_08610 [Bacteroidota bacterium]